MNLKYTYDKKSLIKNGKRWFPMMGEIHYSRVPQQYWKEALLKMKAGGVDIVSSYVIWIHHEEIENEWDFSGQRDLRKFISLVADCGMSMILRIGPWCHGEVRNGGFPDWLLHKNFEVRTNNENYFAEVDAFYKKIFSEVKGLFVRDGGPIIGVQIENEFGHCGGLWGNEGEKHMRRLYKMARHAGFIVPLYTATGWGGAVTAGLLPVMGGYCDAPWDSRTTEIEPSGNFIFTYERNDHAIGNDYGLGEGITFDMNKVPYLTAELGGGLQVTYKRRPVATSHDIGAMSLVKMGSGCNLLGYYMYHGGTNPQGKKTTLEESTATGYPNDLPVLNYDFRAPLGEYGEPSATFGELKLLALFTHEWGTTLCDTKTIIPDDNPLKPDDKTQLRYSWRYNEKTKEGFVFVNNYVRRQVMQEHKNISLAVVLKNGEKITYPAIDVHDKEYFFLPFNMLLGNNILRTALVTPLCVLHNKRAAYVFYKSVFAKNNDSNALQVTPPVTYSASVSSSDITTPLSSDVTLYQFDDNKSDDCDIVTLTREEALNSFKLEVDINDTKEVVKEHLAIADGVFIQTQPNSYQLITASEPSFSCWPELPRVPECFIANGKRNGFFLYKCNKTFPKAPQITWEQKSDTKTGSSFLVTVGQWMQDSLSDSNECCIHDVVMDVAFTGNCARLYEDNKLIADTLYVGPKYSWRIGLKKFGCGRHTFVLEIDTLVKDKPIYLEEWPEIKGNGMVELQKISLSCVVSVPVKL